MQIVPADALLGPVYTGQAIGYRVLALDRTTVHSPFTTDDVEENPASSGEFHVSGGVSVPDEGGYIVWGTSGTDVIEVGIDSAAITTATAQKIADWVLARGAGNAEDLSPEANSLYELIQSVFESESAGVLWKIFKVDGITVFSTRDITLDPAAQPITKVT